MRPYIFVTRALPQGSLDPLRAVAEVRVWEGELPPPREVLLAEARRAHGLITLLTDGIDAEVMDAASHLRIVANVAVGFDNIDLAEATRRAILATNTPGVLTETTADFAFALLMAAGRRLVGGDRYVREGRWRTWGLDVLLGQDIHGATLGLVGLGRVGLGVARRAGGFDMRLLYCDVVRRPREERRYRLTYSELDDLLRQADFVSLHVPLSAETYHLIGERELALMKPTAVLVNTARGQIVDPQALYQALKARRIAVAALDVTDPEPIPMDSPLLELDNLIVTPHIASASVVTRQRMASLAVSNLLAALRGEAPPNCVNRAALRRWRRAMRTAAWVVGKP